MLTSDDLRRLSVTAAYTVFMTATNADWRTPKTRGRKATPATPPAMLPAIDTKQAAVLLGLTENALVMMRKNGAGPVYMRYGRTIRYQPEDIQAYRDAHRVEVS